MLQKHRGELFLLAGALLFSFNGIVSKLVLTSSLSALNLAQVRSTGAFIILFFLIFFRSREKLRVTKKELPQLAFFGIIGVAAVQFLYFMAISRMHVSFALIIEFTAPIWIVLWIKYVKKRFVPTDMWIAIFLAFIGLLFIAQVWKGRTLDTIGLIAAFLDAIALSIYFLMGEKLTKTRDIQSLTFFGFAFATLTWLIILPIWNFPFEVFGERINMQGIFDGFDSYGWVLIAWIIIFGTIVPYLLVITGIKTLSASTSSVIGMVEPVLVGILAWWWLREAWLPLQIFGGVLVMIGIYVADRARLRAH
ncbi:MAG: EamA family transporter [Actinobacteria bacterium]|nr:EamA family transporter [Actinomycetota bacterium]